MSSRIGAAGVGGAAGGGAGGADAFDWNDYITTYNIVYAGAGGGGVGLYGEGSSGGGSSWDVSPGGDAGSGGTAGEGTAQLLNTGRNGGACGGGGGVGATRNHYNVNTSTDSAGYVANGGLGGVGGVRILWGPGRSFPSNAAAVIPPGAQDYNYEFNQLENSAPPYGETYTTTLPSAGYGSHPNGVQVVASMSAATPLQVQTAFTISAWVYVTTAQSNVVLDAPFTTHSPPYYSLHLRIDTNGKPFFGYNVAGTYYSIVGHTTNPGISTNVWSHVAVTYSSGNLVLYVNGAQHNTATNTHGTISYYAAPMTIGKAPNWSGVFGGTIGSVRLYRSYAMSAAQVLAEYNAGFYP